MTSLMRLGPVFQRVDSAIQRINRSPVNKCQPNILRYPRDRNLSSGQCFRRLGVIQPLNNQGLALKDCW